MYLYSTHSLLINHDSSKISFQPHVFDDLINFYWVWEWRTDVVVVIDQRVRVFFFLFCYDDLIPL